MAANLPDLRRDFALPGPNIDWAGRISHVARTVAFGLLCDPRDGRFLDRPQPAQSERVPYQTSDGWRCALTRYRPAPGSSGEPVILAPGLALNHLAVDYHPDVSLVRSLQAQGFDVFVFGQRTDPLASPPLDRKPFDVDTLADDDVCKAIDCVLEVTGFNRCGWVGFGFGGVLLLQQLARGGDSRTLFGVVTLGAPTFFEPSRSAARQARWISRLLPEEGELPTDWALRWLAAGAQTNEEASGLGWANRTEGPRLRGLMQHGVTALPKSVARQVARWVAGGRITDRTGGIDTLTAIRGTPIPLLSIVAQGDSLAPLASADALAEVWDPKAFHRLDLDEGWGHIDLLAGPTAPGAVFAPITRFLDSRRKSAW